MDSKQENKKLKASMSIFTLSQVHSWAMRAKIVVWFRRDEEGRHLEMYKAVQMAKGSHSLPYRRQDKLVGEPNKFISILSFK